jgi:predicted methyltransferase
MHIVKNSVIRGIAAIGLLACSQLGFAQALPDYIQAAVASSERTEEMTVRDANRKPGELLALSGIKPGDTVVEFAGFGQYFTIMLSSIVGEAGKVLVYDLPYTEERAGEASRAFAAAHPNTTYTVVDYNAIEFPAGVDQVHNVLYYHDLSLNQIDTAVLNKKIFDALKPGGVYLIVDHNAEAGSGTRDTETLHRIDPAVIKQEILAAGFMLAEDSNLLAHDADDHTKMVFSPGTRGTTDQSVLKFVKPE